MKLRVEKIVLLKVALLFLPALPAYLWVWPNVRGGFADALQAAVYVYFLAGTVIIGWSTRDSGGRWTPAVLGLSRQGLGLGLVVGAVLLIGRTFVTLAVAWTDDPPRVTLTWLVWQVLYYFCLVGLTEELLFRGLLYRALERWRGQRWAFWGSSLAFALWHAGQGGLIAAAMVFYGMLFALARWRAGGILGLVIAHGAMDLGTAVLISGSNSAVLSQIQAHGHPTVPYPFLLAAGLLLLLALPLYLWLLHPRAAQWGSRRRKVY